jgi:hypothetical protein
MESVFAALLALIELIVCVERPAIELRDDHTFWHYNALSHDVICDVVRIVFFNLTYFMKIFGFTLDRVLRELYCDNTEGVLQLEGNSVNVHRICLGDVQRGNACLHVWPAVDIISRLPQSLVKCLFRTSYLQHLFSQQL